ncbi:MAG TPA: tetratricopeptide repeat protein [Saprospiraceae bacterium]|nr:tetratricopeptide repeat protein [Saprospiraceae bacterium]HQW55290.1 tetratricopeptide repeat protein [Saprospiraceae bacterium]
MSKVNKIKQNIKQQSAASAIVAELPSTNIGGWLRPQWIPWFLGIIVLLMYANTLKGDFMLDDAIVITDNQYTQQGISGLPGIFGKDTFFGFFKKEGKDKLVQGGRYRPLSLAMFALEKEFFGGSAFMYHLMGILMYILCCIFLYVWLRNLFEARFGIEKAVLIALFSTVLFAVHPVHTEVIANIKGRDEVLALLFSLLAAIFSDRALKESNGLKWLLLAGFCFLLALFSKENAIVFLILIPLAQWVFYSKDFKSVIKSWWPLVAFMVIYLMVRFAVLGLPGSQYQVFELMNNPFLEWKGTHFEPVSYGVRLATIALTLFKYLILLIFPLHLTHDYYPQQVPLVNWGNALAISGLLIYSALLIWSIIKIRSKNIYAFGILFFLIALFPMTNIAVTVGTFMSERFLFIPSVGFSLIVGLLLAKYVVKFKTTTALSSVVLLLLLLPGIKTIDRNQIWQSNYTIFTQDLKNSPNSAKLLNSAGGITLDSAIKVTEPGERNFMLLQAQKYLEEAIKLHPLYNQSYLMLGNCLFYQQKYEKAIETYKKLMVIDTGSTDGPKNLALAYREYGKFAGEKEGNIQKALDNLSVSLRYNPNDAETNRLMGVAYGFMKDPKTALPYFLKSVELNPKDPNSLFDLGNAYYQLGDPVNGAKYHDEAIKINPELGSKINK